MRKSKLFFTLALASHIFTGISAQYKVGDAVSDFKLLNVDGKYVSLSQFQDAKGYIVIFTCNVCPVAIKYEERMINLDKEFRDKGFPVIAINSNDKKINPGDSYEEMQKLAKKRNFPYPYLYDESQEVARRFGATNTPHIFVVSNNNGTRKVEYIGAIDNNVDDPSAAEKKYVVGAVSALLKGEKPAITKTVAVGCGLKWKKS